MDKNLKEILIELQKQNYQMRSDFTDLVISSNEMAKELVKLKSPTIAKGLCDEIDKKNKDAIRIFNEYADAYAENSKRIDPDF